MPSQHSTFLTPKRAGNLQLLRVKVDAARFRIAFALKEIKKLSVAAAHVEDGCVLARGQEVKKTLSRHRRSVRQVGPACGRAQDSAAAPLEYRAYILSAYPFTTLSDTLASLPELDLLTRGSRPKALLPQVEACKSHSQKSLAVYCLCHRVVAMAAHTTNHAALAGM